jgi:diguanylate cyclase (GGDEF)-like protein/PAS domain S-box-containing protein
MPNGSFRGTRRSQSLLPAAAIVMLAGLIVTLVLAAGVWKLERETEHLNFEEAANAQIGAVIWSFRDAIDALYTVNLLFAARDDVSREEFYRFARPLMARCPYVQALVFHRFVSGPQRAAFEAERRKSFPGFRITERSPAGLVTAAPRGRYLVDDFVAPIQGNEIILGYDAWSHPPQREAVQRMIDTGLPVTSFAGQLLQNKGAMRGVVVAKPVYLTGVALTDPAARNRAAIGDTEMVLDIGQLIGGNLKASGLHRPGASLGVFGVWQGSTPAVEFHSGSVASGRTLSETRWFDVAGQRWKVTFSTAAQMSHYLGAIATLVFGTLLSLAAAAVTGARAMRTGRVEALVRERTADLKRTADALHLHQRAMESSANTIIIISAAGPDYPITYVNPAFQRMTGYTPGEVLGRSVFALGDAETDQPAIHELRLAIRERRQGHTLLRHFHKDGRVMFSETVIAPVNNEAGETEHFVVSQYDVTKTRAYEAELEHRAKYDTLTGLANRALLHDRLEQAVAMAGVRAETVSVIILDLDQFKVINDSLGHQAGDEMLRVLAPRIAAAIRQTDSVARMGGDEFALVLTHRDNETQAVTAVRAAIDAIGAPMTIQGHAFAVTCSAGVAVYPADGTDPQTLIKHAEIAMYRAKESGRNAIQFFTATMNARARERLTLEAALRQAIERDEFELHYQPQVHLASGRIVGMEALIRWRHPQMGLVGPDRFIGLAEETGQIVRIGEWVLRTACAQNMAWQRDGTGLLRVAVNLSARQFAQPQLAGLIAGILDETGLPAACLELELTESLVMDNIDQAIVTMRALKHLGVQLSVDDFGTGYSSLSYLKHFPVDVLKIDQSFVRDITVHPDDAAMVRGIILLAHSLHLHVIAEGVETPAQLDYLHRHGCDEIQGHLFSHAVPAAEFENVLREGRRVRLEEGAAVVCSSAHEA